MTRPDPPDLLGYRTWTDHEGYHAELCEHLPEEAVAYGCQQQLAAPTSHELIQAAVANQIKVSIWETLPSAGPECLACGDRLAPAPAGWRSTRTGAFDCSHGGHHRVDVVTPDPDVRLAELRVALLSIYLPENRP